MVKKKRKEKVMVLFGNYVFIVIFYKLHMNIWTDVKGSGKTMTFWMLDSHSLLTIKEKLHIFPRCHKLFQLHFILHDMSDLLLWLFLPISFQHMLNGQAAAPSHVPQLCCCHSNPPANKSPYLLLPETKGKHMNMCSRNRLRKFLWNSWISLE